MLLRDNVWLSTGPDSPSLLFLVMPWVRECPPGIITASEYAHANIFVNECVNYTCFTLQLLIECLDNVLSQGLRGFWQYWLWQDPGCQANVLVHAVLCMQKKVYSLTPSYLIFVEIWRYNMLLKMYVIVSMYAVRRCMLARESSCVVEDICWIICCARRTSMLTYVVEDICCMLMYAHAYWLMMIDVYCRTWIGTAEVDV